MKYDIKAIKRGDIWNEFVKKEDLANILSCWEWIEFEKEFGFEVFPFGIFEKDSLKGVFAFRKISAKKGKYLILRQNTFLDWENEEIVFSFVSFLKKRTKEMNCSFFRISPPLLTSFKKEKLFKQYGFKKSSINPTDAQVTTVLDLSQDLDNILAKMRKNTRYMIRKGEKLGVEILNIDGDEYLDEFEKIYEQTVGRNVWNAEGFDYVKKQYKFFSLRKKSRMFVAKYEGKILAIAMFSKFNKQIIYHHSGTVNEQRDIPAMYILMWEVIKYYKEEGLRELNFFGVCEKENTKHPWYGLSLFKRGFGGDERLLMHTYDYPVNVKYVFTKIIESLQKY